MKFKNIFFPGKITMMINLFGFGILIYMFGGNIYLIKFLIMFSLGMVTLWIDQNYKQLKKYAQRRLYEQ